MTFCNTPEFMLVEFLEKLLENRFLLLPEDFLLILGKLFMLLVLLAIEETLL